jgi:hypothetical protein
LILSARTGGRLAALAILLAGPAAAQSRLPLPDLGSVEPFRGTAHPRLDELNTAHPPLVRQDDLREPDLTRPRMPLPSLPTTIIGTVRASDRVGEGAVGRIRDIYPALRACWEPPGGGGETTVRFAFRRDGRILGESRVTWAAPGPERERERLRRSIVDALRACAPLAFSPSFGQAIAGRPVAIRFIDDRAR